MKLSASRLASVLAAAFVAGGVSAAPVVTSTTSFDAFADGSVNGQGGWGISNDTIFQQVVNLGGGNKAWQLTNRVTSGGFGDQAFSPRPGGVPVQVMGVVTDPTPNPAFFAGETSTGASYNQFVASFDFMSVAAVLDPGAFITISPDSGEGGRQGWIRLTSVASGVQVEGLNYAPDGSFAISTLATVAFQQWNTIRYEIDFFDGANNDVGRVYLNNALVSTTRSWENFYDVFQSALHPNRVAVQSLIFRSSGIAAPNAQGFYIDNVVTQVSNRGGDVPEPASLALVGLALTGMFVAGRTRRPTPLA